MKSNMAQYKDLFIQTAREYLGTLNKELLLLEKTPGNSEAIEAIFRAMHSLKGQSAAMGYEQTGYLCHVIEDAFYKLKEQRRKLDSDLADLLFRALDSLSESVAHIEAADSELPVSTVAEQLKHATGVQTVGAGHTVHEDEAPHATSIPQPEVHTVRPVTTTHEPTPKNPPVQEYMSHKEITSIPVKVEQLDDIAGSLEELMVNRLTMQSLVHTVGIPALIRVQDKVGALIEQLQYQVMKIRIVPVSLVFDHFPRAVRDLGRALHKQIEVRIEGGDLELDRVIVERLDEPLTHLVRNAADHGIGEKGIITMKAHADRDAAIISVADDGAGIDWQAVAGKAGVDPGDQAALKRALFSGISTAKEVSLISGRGVGLEAVKKTVEDMNGRVDVTSTPGHGTIFTLRLPLTLSVIRTLIVRVSYQRYAIAASAVERSLQLHSGDIVKSVGQEAFRYKDQEVPLIRLQHIFGNVTDAQNTPSSIYAVMLNIDGERTAVAVDDISETLETVVRPLPDLLKGSPMFSGVAVIGDGSTVLLINPRGFTNG
jgi:two-component system, chemotaxis family, sensor kinase CheA